MLAKGARIPFINLGYDIKSQTKKEIEDMIKNMFSL